MVAEWPSYLRWHCKGQIEVQHPRGTLLLHPTQITENCRSRNLSLTIPTSLRDDSSDHGTRGVWRGLDQQRHWIQIDGSRILEVVILDVLVKPFRELSITYVSSFCNA